MKQEMVTIPKKVYKEMLEEIGILHNTDMMEQIRDSEEAERRGIKSWKIKINSS